MSYAFPTGGLLGNNTSTPLTRSASAANVVGVGEGISRGGALYFGANLQSGSLVAGFEADLNIPKNKKRISAFSSKDGAPSADYDENSDPAATSDAKSELTATMSHRRMWDGSVRARMGLLLAPQVLLYGAAGIAIGRFNHTAAVANTVSFMNTSPATDAAHAFALSTADSETKLGWTIGGGVELKLTPSLMVRTEYRYADFGKDNYLKRGTATCAETTAGACATLAPGQGTMRADFNNSFHTVRVGLAYHFASSDPVPAR